MTPRTRAALGTIAFLVLAPGVVAGVVPWLLTDWRTPAPAPPWPLRLAGAVLVAAGVAVILEAFARFVREGRGTPAPVAPTETLVVGGAYRYVRNPMYLAVLSMVLGQAAVLGRPVLLVYGVVVAVAFVTFVKLYEEPTLARRHGERYASYRRAVPGWVPRLRPWNPP
jgi:protein-S-isoprenylcysteine O-methyltransferase Ste14